MIRLRNIRELGIFENTETGKQYNLKKGTRVGRSTDLIFYLYRGTRMFISDLDYYRKYKRI